MQNPPLRQRFQTLLANYGKIAIAIHFSIFGLSMLGFALAIHFGVKIEGIAGTAGTLTAAYAGTQLIKPLRFIATLALTPLIARLLGQRKTPEAAEKPP